MVNRYLVLLFCATIVLIATSHAPADTYIWAGAAYTTGNNGVPYDIYNWAGGGNWGLSGNPSVAGDSASITVTPPWATQYIVNLNQAVTLGSLFLQENAPVGSNYGFGIYGTSYALTFQASSGNATLSAVIPNHDATAVIQPNIVLNSPLAVDVFSNDPYEYGWTAQPNDYWGRYSHGLILLGTITGTGQDITKTGLGALWLNNANSTFTGNIHVQQGWLWANGAIASASGAAGALGAYNNNITLGSPGEIGHLSFAYNRGTEASSTLVAPISLAGEGGDLRVDMRNDAVFINSVISGGSSGAILLLGGAEGNMTFNGGANNTYTGRTIVQQYNVCVTSSNVVFPGDVTIDPIGNLALTNAGSIGGAITVGGTQTSSVSNPSAMALGALYLESDAAGAAIAKITSASSGILGIDCVSDANINTALQNIAAAGQYLGNGYMAYGSCNGGTYTGAALPSDADGVYRFVVTGAGGISGGNYPAGSFFYSGAGLTLDAAGTTTGVLTGNTITGALNKSVVVSENSSLNAWNGFQWTTTLDANDFGGSLTVYPGAGFAGYAQPASASYAGYDASPFGTAAGAINLVGGGLKLIGAANGLPVNKGALNFQGSSYIALNGGSGNVASLTFTNINRLNGGVLVLDLANTNGGTYEQLIDANHASDFTVNNGMVAPWAISWRGSGSFLTYDNTNGLMVAAFTDTNNLAAAGPTDIVRLSASPNTTMTQDQEVYALADYGYPINGTGYNLTIDSGGFIAYAGNQTYQPNIIFGTTGPSGTHTEGIIYNMWGSTFTGNLTANNGLTITGRTQDHGFYCYLTGNNTIMSNDGANPGTLTINGGGCVMINSAGAIGGSGTTVYINGGGGDSNAQIGSGIWGGLGMMNDLSLSNTITLGPLGGVLYAGGNNLTIAGPIDGSGALGLYGGGNIYLNGANTYAGGTTIKEASVYVASGSSLSTGPVLVYDTFDQNVTSKLFLQGPGNISPGAAVAIVQDNSMGGGGIYVQCASATWGSLEGNGLVWLAGSTGANGNGDAPCTLTIGGTTGSPVNSSTEFTGKITDNSYQNSGSVGSLVKNGGGTFNLIGDALLAGTVTVNGGTLAVSGTLGSAISTAGDVTVNAGGTLNGAGRINRNVDLAGGTLGGTLQVNGNLTAAGGVLAGNPTISGTMENTAGTLTVTGTPGGTGLFTVSGGTVTGSGAIPHDVSIASGGTMGGSLAITGNVTLYGGAFKGNHTVHGNLTTTAGSGAVVAPSDDTRSAGTLTIIGNVSLDNSTTLNFNLGAPGTIGGGINDLITITGNLSLDGTLNVNALTGFSMGVYRLFNYTGTLTEPSGSLAVGTTPGLGYTYTVDTGTPGQVNLDVIGYIGLGDTNEDGFVNSLDIDAIYHNFGAPATSQWKVSPDGLVVGQEDVTYELRTYFHTNYGDANLDGKTDFLDFQVLLDHWQAAGPNIGWAQGDFNGDYTVDFLDFQKLLDYWNPGGWNFAPAQTPEPASLSLILLGGLALLRRSRK